MFIELFVLFILNICGRKKKNIKIGGGYDYDTSSLLIADSLIHTDDGHPKTFNESVEKDPFLNEEYDDGPDW